MNNLQLAGITQEGTTSTSLKLYMREEAKELWNCLQNSARNALVLISGCPGVGKSVVVFAQTMYDCWNNNKSLLYYHDDMEGATCFVMDRHGVVRTVEGSSAKFVSSQRESYDVTVIDGIHTEADMHEMFFNFPNCNKCIVCTCYQALKICQEVEYRKKPGELIQRSVTSWTLEDYIGATDEGCFSFWPLPDAAEIVDGKSAEERKMEIIMHRFKICGGTVRLFAGEIAKALSSIRSALADVNDFKVFYGNRVGDLSADAVNRLMALYRTDDGRVNSVPLSQYVFEELGDKCSNFSEIAKFISEARKALPNNPTWQGWVTEYEVESILRFKKKLIVHYDADKHGKKAELSCNNMIQLRKGRVHESLFSIPDQ